MSETTQQLEQLGEGSHPCYYGWISVKRKKDHWDVMWTTDETSHYYGYGDRAVSVDFCDNGKIGWVFRSSISMWPVHDPEKKEVLVYWMRKKIHEAANPRTSWLSKITRWLFNEVSQ